MVCGHRLCDNPPSNKTLKWLLLLPKVMQNQSGGDSAVTVTALGAVSLFAHPGDRPDITVSELNCIQSSRMKGHGVFNHLGLNRVLNTKLLTPTWEFSPCQYSFRGNLVLNQLIHPTSHSNVCNACACVEAKHSFIVTDTRWLTGCKTAVSCV